MPDLQLCDGGPVGRAGPDLEPSIFTVEPVPPFRLDHTARALQRRAINAVDRFDGSIYRRILIVDGRPLDVEVAQIAPPELPMLRVIVRGAGLARCARSSVTSALARLLGLDRDLAEFYRTAASDPVLRPLAQAFCGLKPPRFATLFETLLNAFACQQVTLSLGVLLLNRLAEACAPALDGPGGRAFAFPSPEDLAGRAPDELRALGFSRQKARAIIELARALAEHRLDLDAIEHFDDRAAVARLCALRGVGRWSAEYVLLRGLGRLHVFPGDDVGARNNLQRWLGLLEPLDYDGVQRTLAKWQPFQGLVYLHLLLKALQLEGERHSGPTRRRRRLEHGMLR
jgi:DNA-3-methyladenine glycosylase II